MALSDPFFAPVGGDDDGPGRVGAARSATWRELVIAALVALLVALPFVDKAVGQDDWAYLTVGGLAAEHGPGDLAGLFAEETLYQGRRITVAQGILHGPVWVGALAALHAAGEENVVPLARGLAALLFALLAASAAAIAARLGLPPIATGLALALSPGPLLLAGTAMTDLPMLALFVAALALAIEGAARGTQGSLPLLVAAGVVAGLAALTRYPGMAVIPMLLATPTLLGRVRLRAFLPAVIAAVALLAWLWITRSASGDLDPSRGMEAISAVRVERRITALAALCGLGGLAAGWFASIAVAPRRFSGAILSDPILLAVATGGLGVGAWLAIDAHALRDLRPPGINAALQAAFLILGTVLALAAVRPWIDAGSWRAGPRAWKARRGAEAWLSLWLVGFLVAAIFFVPFGAARYVLPALPPAVFLAALFCVRRLGRRATLAALWLSAFLGVACAVADENAAGVYERYGAEIGARRAPGGVWSEHDLWVWGELGFRWYLERDADARVIPRSSTAPDAGDRILSSGMCTAASSDGRDGIYTLTKDLRARMYTEDHFVHADGWPIRVHNPRSGAGFYQSEAGILPWAISAAVHDEIQTWLVKEPSELLNGFPDATVEPMPGVTKAPRVKVDRFLVRPDLPSFPALCFFDGARVTWPAIEVPTDRPWLVLHAGEHYRLAYESVPGPGATVRVFADDELVDEVHFDGRADEADRRWFALSADLSRWAGRAPRITLEVAPDPWPEERGSGVLLVGLADPRLSADPLPEPDAEEDEAEDDADGASDG